MFSSPRVTERGHVGEVAQIMKSVMAGQQISFIDKIKANYEIYKCFDKGVFGDPRDVVCHYEKICSIIDNHLPEFSGKILEIGCGQLAIYSCLLANQRNYQVHALDIEQPTFDLNILKTIQIAKQHGVDRAIKSFIRSKLFDKKTINGVERLLNTCLDYSKLQIRITSACNTGYEDNKFGFIFSNDVFEHIDDISQATNEIYRILSPSGVAWITVHLFHSLSGGHRLEWMDADKKPSNKVPPWDHLRNNEFKVNTYLNKEPISRYRELFSSQFEILSEVVVQEGLLLEHQLVFEELLSKGYTHEELTSKTISFVLRKRNK